MKASNQETGKQNDERSNYDIHICVQTVTYIVHIKWSRFNYAFKGYKNLYTLYIPLAMSNRIVVT